MNKQVLSPFDCDMCAMIEDITKQEIEVTASDTSIRLSWAQNGSEGNDRPEAQRIEILKQAIRGRLGDRFIEFFYADGRQSVYMKYDPEEYPEEMRTRLTDPDATAGTRYCRTLLEVDAIQFRRDNVDDVLRSTVRRTKRSGSNGGVLADMFPGSEIQIQRVDLKKNPRDKRRAKNQQKNRKGGRNNER